MTKKELQRKRDLEKSMNKNLATQKADINHKLELVKSDLSQVAEALGVDLPEGAKDSELRETILSRIKEVQNAANGFLEKGSQYQQLAQQFEQQVLSLRALYKTEVVESMRMIEQIRNQK